MRRLLSITVSITLALWLGGLITLFLAVTSLFHTFADRSRAGMAAAGIFHTFERYQLILAAVALVATFGWRLLPVRRPAAPQLKTGLFALLALAAMAAVYSTMLVTPGIEALRERGITGGAEFARLHGTSMLLYVGEAVLLLVAGLLVPTAIARDAANPPPETTPAADTGRE